MLSVFKLNKAFMRKNEEQNNDFFQVSIEKYSVSHKNSKSLQLIMYVGVVFISSIDWK